jgi:hypothetical protein
MSSWFRIAGRSPYLPLGESQVHLASSLGSNSLILLQASADDAGGDGQVAVVAIRKKGFC